MNPSSRSTAGMYYTHKRPRPGWLARKWHEFNVWAFRRQMALVHSGLFGDETYSGTLLMMLSDELLALGDAKGAAQEAREAVSLFRRIGSREEELSALIRAGIALGDAEQYGPAVLNLDQARRLARQLGITGAEMAALTDLVWCHAATGDFEAVADRVEQYAAAIQPLPADERAKHEQAFLYRIADECMQARRFEEGAAYAERAIQAAQPLRREQEPMTAELRAIVQLRVQALTILGTDLADAGDFEPARQRLEAALATAQATGDRESESMALWNLSLLYEKQDLRHEAIDHGERAFDLLCDLNIRDDRADEAHAWLLHQYLERDAKFVEELRAYLDRPEPPGVEPEMIRELLAGDAAMRAEFYLRLKQIVRQRRKERGETGTDSPDDTGPGEQAPNVVVAGS